MPHGCDDPVDDAARKSAQLCPDHYAGIDLAVFTAEQIADIARDAPINPKVAPLVEALNRCAIRTVMSGDLYGEDLVYVDFDDAHGLDFSRLPKPWVLTTRDINDTKRDVFQPTLDQGAAYAGFGWRLARRGGDVTIAEAGQIVAAMQPRTTADEET